MADFYYGIDKGASTYEVTAGIADQNKTVQVKVKVQPGVERSQVLVALEQLQDYILRTSWPPVTPSP